MLTRWCSRPIKSRFEEYQPIRGIAQSIELKTRLSFRIRRRRENLYYQIENLRTDFSRYFFVWPGVHLVTIFSFGRVNFCRVSLPVYFDFLKSVWINLNFEYWMRFKAPQLERKLKQQPDVMFFILFPPISGFGFLVGLDRLNQHRLQRLMHAV